MPGEGVPLILKPGRRSFCKHLSNPALIEVTSYHVPRHFHQPHPIFSAKKTQARQFGNLIANQITEI